VSPREHRCSRDLDKKAQYPVVRTLPQDSVSEAECVATSEKTCGAADSAAVAVAVAGLCAALRKFRKTNHPNKNTHHFVCHDGKANFVATADEMYFVS
jgi:hypothetical protein